MVKLHTFILVLLIVSASALAQDTTRFAMPPPPLHALRVTVKRQPFYSGMVYLGSGNDTMVLRPLGFQDFEFQGRSGSSIRYHVFWPRAASHDSLPGIVSWIEYDIDSTSVLDSLPDLELPGQSEPPAEPEPEPQPTPGGSGNN